jgi:peptidoglycan-associated lipoprotein
MFVALRMMGVVACVLLVAMVSSGCRTKRNLPTNVPVAVTNEPVTPVKLTGSTDDGTVPLVGERTADGIRVTDVVFESVLFEFDSFKLRTEELPKVEKIAEYLRKNAAVRLVTEGHCDERGSNEYNMALGEHRAQAVRAHLVGLGIDGARIQTRSFGEEKPLDPGHIETAWRLNRRCEFALYR